MSPDTGIIFKIKKYALHDGPGIRTTLFLKGCPLRCPWCHNPEGLMPEPQIVKADPGSTGGQETIGREISVVDALTEIKKDTIFYDESGGGATFSGGDPLMQAPFLTSLLTACRGQEIHTAVDTSGHAPAHTFVDIVRMADLILFDVKIIDDNAHRIGTGESNARIIENLKALPALGKDFRIRFPLVPGITDSDENIRAVAELVRSLGRRPGVDILPYHRSADAKYRRFGIENSLPDLDPPSSEAIAAVRERFQDGGLDVAIGG